MVPLTALSLDTRCLNALTAYLRYAGELVWPRHLTVIYPYVHQWPPGLIVAPLGFLVVVSGLGLWCRRQAPWVVVGWLWYLGTLVPVLGLVQVGDQPIADRYTYIPSIGLFILVAWTVPWLLARWSPRKPVLAAGAGLALAACALCTRAQLAYWQDSRALFEHAIAVTKDNAVAYHNLGLTFMERGQLDQALGCYQHTLELNPNYSPAHNNLGVALARLGRFDEAIAHYRSALELHPEDADVHYNLANALNPGFVETYARNQTENRSEWTDPAQARAQYEAALRLNPELVNAQINWANLELTEGNYQAAATHYRDALRLAPTDALAHFDLANVLVKLGRTNDAVASYSRAVELDPNNAVAHFRLANLLVLQGDAEGAATHYQRVVSLSPGNSFAGHELGSVLAKLGRFDEAAHWFGEAVRLNPDSAEAHLSLAKALVKSGRGDLAVAEFRAALKLQPDSVQALNNLAWVLATEPRPDVRDGAEAVKLALRACELTLYQEPVVLGTLDAAYAEAGQSEKAAEAARQTIELAQARGKTDLADKARARLRLYQARQPFREPGPSQQPTNP